MLLVASGIYADDLFGFTPAFDMAEVSRERNAGCDALKVNLAISGGFFEKMLKAGRPDYRLMLGL
ncbi:hypothetical protein G6L37_25270 [Agrobacterium rubi]|uniref:Uncharacterized protein n=1 Tax=Agrobacterium rubi TR3 = NBRC 13261 TaxID=1368415 RepID=A0A081CT52_9HYPH|nr:hypothetical protein [Agrobacterium rubi]MBP1878636.1 hypothetical protein [Agrobacterium rubi]MCL6653003.1 hypothetical protein [Agrobacterium rubi]NTF10101.1 hypothetical protein [Agrobacterium rubi]NTF21721.1 hypothetical protein [Agrobacterium rubi]NTF28578.1 hypothetical protein [Agrobacterium rubi]